MWYFYVSCFPFLESVVVLQLTSKMLRIYWLTNVTEEFYFTVFHLKKQLRQYNEIAVVELSGMV